jgi:hypothetical protein
MYDELPGVDKGPIYLWSVLFVLMTVLLLMKPIGLAVLAIVLLPLALLAFASQQPHRRRYGIALLAMGLLSLAVFLCVGIAAVRSGSGAL